MTEQQSLADKILSELPEELAAVTRFEGDEKGNLHMFFGFKLADTDFPLVLEVVRRYNGDFAKKKDAATGKDVGYFYIPKPKPETSDDTSQCSATQQPAASPAPQVQPKEQEKAPSDAKPEEKKGVPKISDKIKQPSPLTFFSKNHCENCEDLGDKCNTTTTSGREYRAQCLDTLKIDSLEFIARSLEKMSQKVPEKASSGPVSSSPPATQSEKVERSTRPTEGHREGDIVWIWAENQGGERYEKALEKDNQRSNDFFAMRNMIVDAEKAGKKGLVLEGKWCWVSKQRDYIGRKPAKEFPNSRGGRR